MEFALDLSIRDCVESLIAVAGVQPTRDLIRNLLKCFTAVDRFVPSAIGEMLNRWVEVGVPNLIVLRLQPAA